MLESRKELKAVSERMASSNFIFLTLRSNVRKSPATEGLLLVAVVDGVASEEETRVGVSEGCLIKKMYIKTRIAPAPRNSIMFLICDDILIL